MSDNVCNPDVNEMSSYVSHLLGVVTETVGVLPLVEGFHLHHEYMQVVVVGL